MRLGVGGFMQILYQKTPRGVLFQVADYWTERPCLSIVSLLVLFLNLDEPFLV